MKGAIVNRKIADQIIGELVAECRMHGITGLSTTTTVKSRQELYHILNNVVRMDDYAHRLVTEAGFRLAPG